MLSQIGCKLHALFTYIPIHCSAWILVAITAERVISVFFPFRSREIVTCRRALLLLAGIVVCVTGLDLHSLWTYSIYTDTYGHISCTAGPNQSYHDFYTKYFVWIDAFVASYIPFCVMLISNIAIIIKLTQARIKRKSHMNVHMKSSSGRGSMTLVLLTLNFVFLITTSPSVIFLSFQETFRGDGSPHAMSKFYLAYVITGVLSYCNSALNFVLYCLTGSRFRRDMAALFCRRHIGKDTSVSKSNRTSITNASEESVSVRAIAYTCDNNADDRRI